MGAVEVKDVAGKFDGGDLHAETGGRGRESFSRGRIGLL